MKTNLSQLERISSNATTITPNSTLQDNLRCLRLTYLLENAVQAAGNGNGHLQYLQELIAGEVALRHEAASSAASMTPDSRSPKP